MQPTATIMLMPILLLLLALLLLLQPPAVSCLRHECKWNLTNCGQTCGSNKQPALVMKLNSSCADCMCKPCDKCSQSACQFNAKPGEEALRPQPIREDQIGCSKCDCECYEESDLPASCQVAGCTSYSRGLRGCPICAACAADALNDSLGSDRSISDTHTDTENNRNMIDAALKAIEPAAKQLMELLRSIGDQQPKAQKQQQDKSKAVSNKQPQQKATKEQPEIKCKWLRHCQLSCGSKGHRRTSDGCPICQCRATEDESCNCTCAADSIQVECVCNCEASIAGIRSLQQESSRTLLAKGMM